MAISSAPFGISLSYPLFLAKLWRTPRYAPRIADGVESAIIGQRKSIEAIWKDQLMNRLANETSPYLRQHADNPVDWYPWGEEALARAKTEDKPILLSIGYSACHWCHVMERESFENEEVAALMNEEFVCIKVDREERPDLDHIYMQAVQAMTGRGGWPLTVFLTPDGIPFYGGTYYPPEDRQGLPGFPRVLRSVANSYRHRQEEISRTTTRLIAFLQQDFASARTDTPLAAAILDQALTVLLRQFDAMHGGFGGAPKFPQAMLLDFLLRSYHRIRGPRLRQALERTLLRMGQGGIYDQLGGGFHRYAVDTGWLVPHFEKMLYDNALLSKLYLDAYQALGDPFYRRVAEETLDYVQRDMTSPEGGFYSSEDADSEGEEGRYYLWTREEIETILGQEEAAILCRYYGLDEGPNFEGRNILSIPRDPDVAAHLAGVSLERFTEIIQRGRKALLAAREKRVRPSRDEKILASWNGLMLRSFARATQVLGREDYCRTATRNAAFLLERMRHASKLWRTYKDGQGRLNGYLEDYAAVGNGLLDLWEATFDPRWFVAARGLAATMVSRFWDPAHGNFYDTGDDHEDLIVRPKNLQDNATPSGNALAAELLLRLAHYVGEPAYAELAADALRNLTDAVTKHPQAFGHWLCVLDFHLGSPKEIAISGDPEAADTQAMLEIIHGMYLPNKVLAVGLPGSAVEEAVPLLQGRSLQEGKATAYICRDFTCQTPITDLETLKRELSQV